MLIWGAKFTMKHISTDLSSPKENRAGRLVQLVALTKPLAVRIRGIDERFIPDKVVGTLMLGISNAFRRFNCNSVVSLFFPIGLRLLGLSL